MQGNEFARKGKWNESGRFGKVRNLQGTENARKDKLESARKGNCKEWNLDGNGICKEWTLQGMQFASKGLMLMLMNVQLEKCFSTLFTANVQC